MKSRDYQQIDILKVPFFRLKLGPTEKKSVYDVIKSGWLTTGPRVREFQQKVCKLTEAKYAVAVSSGTAGLFLAMKALSIGKGDEVITTAYTMVATVEAILHCGAKPVLVDIDPITLNIDYDSIKKKITKNTKAIITVDIAGWPCDYKPLKKLAKDNKLYLIDDAAHALGCKYGAKPIGSISDLSVFSFYPTKNITSGEGGMAVSNSKKTIKKIKHLSLHAMSSSGWKRYSGGSWKYDVTDLGYKFNLSDLSAGLALGQLKRFETMQNKRVKMAARYKSNLSYLSDYIELPYEDKTSTHAWHLFIIKLNLSKLKITRNRFIAEMEKCGIGCGVHFIPIYHFSYYNKNPKFNIKDFPNCEKSFKRVVSLPFYTDLSIAEVDYVCEVIKKLIKQYKKI